MAQIIQFLSGSIEINLKLAWLLHSNSNNNINTALQQMLKELL